MLTARRNWTNFQKMTFLGPIRTEVAGQIPTWVFSALCNAENHRPVLIIVTEVPGTTDWCEYLNANLTN